MKIKRVALGSSAFFGVCVTVFLVLLFFVSTATAVDAIDPTLQIPKPGDNALHILSPNLLELVRINTKQPTRATVDSWDWVDANGNFVPPDMSSIKVVDQRPDEHRDGDWFQAASTLRAAGDVGFAHREFSLSAIEQSHFRRAIGAGDQ